MNRLSKLKLTIALSVVMAGIFPGDVQAAGTSDSGRRGCMSIPSTAVQLYVDSLRSSHAIGPDDEEEEDINRGRGYFAYSLNYYHDIEIQCQRAVIIHKAIRARAYSIFNQQYDSGSITSIAYCVERPLADRQMVSLQRKCITDPTTDCYRPDVLEYLSRIRPTEWAEELQMYSSRGKFQNCRSLR